MREMKGSTAVAFLGLVISQIALAGQLIAAKQAQQTGMSNFTIIFYSNAIASFLLLPSFFIHRSRPPLTFPILCRMILLGLIGWSVQLLGCAGIRYSPASFSSAILNLIPGFTFVLAIIFRMERADCRSSSFVAKCIGTALSIAGALIATLYQGPSLLTPYSNSFHGHLLLKPQTNLVLGGSLLALDCAVAALLMILQALLVKKYPAELIIIFFYCFVIAILSAAISLVLEGDRSSWILKPTSRLVAILFSGVFGPGFQLSIGIWCIRRTGPLFVAMFLPLGIVISAFMGIILLGDAFHLGILVGSIVIVVGFFAVMWGKAKEGNMVDGKLVSSLESSSKEEPLLQNDV